MKNKYKIIIIAIIFILLIVVTVLSYLTINKIKVEKSSNTTTTTTTTTTSNINEYEEKNFMVTSLEDEIGSDAAWCGTFNLIWNDLKNDIAKQDIIFSEMTDQVRNLNKGTFTTKELSDSSYYKVYGVPTPELKSTIKKNIKEKFNQESDILDDFDFDSNPNSTFLYTMLYKEFSFLYTFDKLEKSKFNNTTDTEYFGISSSSKDDLDDNIEVISYTDSSKFIIKLNTKSNDEIYIYKGSNETSFLEAWNKISESQSEENNLHFGDNDTFRMPYLNLNVKTEYTALNGKEFLDSEGKTNYISKNAQTLKFELNENGGKVKSEAGIVVKSSSYVEPKEYNIDSSFVLFIKETDSTLPYVALKVTDLTQFQ